MSLSYSRLGRFKDISELQTSESLEPGKTPRAASTNIYFGLK